MKNILVVDDNEDCLSLVKILLESEGMTAECAESGEDALRELSAKAFHLMVTDLNLPGIDGFAIVQQAMEIAPGMPIIMMTGETSPDITRLAVELGIVKVIFKPFTSHEMVTTIRDVLKTWTKL
ncbi:response regulator [Geobacter sp. DSM 9736]|uniref:response regulator n=1 Tax=Geobacter sp. DSM 9736 TaxID=1277350 RepID=UPI000B511E37|nr:response regulator [Geobacter sp. DSM 9736]SNB45534.1 Response regulator receiver domain-containing protein [Geobacter sp. DSM 9736]